MLVSIGVIVLRRTRPDLKRGFKVPLMPWIPIVAVIACLWLMVNLSVETWLRFVIWMAIGVVIYFTYSKGNADKTIREREQEDIEREAARSEVVE